MSVTADTLYVTANDAAPIAIEENARLPKALSCIPVLGVVVSTLYEIALANKTRQTVDVPKLVELINVKNQYKVASVMRNLLTAALMVQGIALGIFGGMLIVISIGLHIGLAGLYIYQISQNNQVVKTLQTDGWKSGIRIT